LTCHNLLEIASVIANSIIALTAIIGIPLIWYQIRLQRQDSLRQSVINLYEKFDTDDARKKRRFIYQEMPKAFRGGKLSANAESQTRFVLAHLDQMAYLVLRGFADRQAAYDLYGVVLLKTMVNVWPWLIYDRDFRGDAHRFRYCRCAEQLALQFAKKALKELRMWNRKYSKLNPEQQLTIAVKEITPTNKASHGKNSDVV
jgi:hypothetical protein